MSHQSPIFNEPSLAGSQKGIDSIIKDTRLIESQKDIA